MGGLDRKAAGAAVSMWLALAGAANAECVSAPAFPPAPLTGLTPTSAVGDAVSAATRRDFGGRVVAPVYVNGQGPFRFIVDTGANRSVLSSAVAAQLGLTPTSIGEVHSISSVALAPLVNVDSITFQGLRLDSAALPILDGGALGEHGVLGVDGMRGHRLRIDFERGCMEIMRDSNPAPQNWWAVQGELRMGNLLLARATIEGVPVNVLVDSGSDVTLANHALRTAIGRARLRRSTAFLATSITSNTQRFSDYALTLPDVRMGGVTIRNLSAYPADFHIFDLWGLQDEPTLLIGMDALSAVGAMEIDYANARLFFRRERVESTRARVHGD
jgi:predicted aspartyl protease